MTLQIAFLLCLLFGSVHAFAQPRPAEVAHAQAVEKMLVATGHAEFILAHMRRMGATGAANSELLRHMGTHLRQADVARKFGPQFAPLLSTETALWITRVYRTAHGRKMDAYNLAALQASGNVRLPETEMHAVASINSSPVAQVFSALRDRTRVAIIPTLHAWLGEYRNNLRTRAIAAMDRHANAVDMQSATAPSPFSPAKTGVASIDAWIMLIARTNERRTRAEWQYGADMRALGPQALLAPANLVSRAALARSLAVLEKMDAITETLLREMEMAMEKFAAESERLGTSGGRPPDPGLLQELKGQSGLTARYADNRRAKLRTTRAILAFAAAREGQLALDNGNLSMQNEADSKAYNALVLQLRRQTREGDALAEQAGQQRANRR